VDLDWFHLAQDRDENGAAVNTGMNIQVAQKAESVDLLSLMDSTEWSQPSLTKGSQLRHTSCSDLRNANCQAKCVPYLGQQQAPCKGPACVSSALQVRSDT
jgi:hypothetical protein